MIKIKALFIGPIDEFMTTRFTLYLYGNMLKDGEMD